MYLNFIYYCVSNGKIIENLMVYFNSHLAGGKLQEPPVQLVDNL
jgi:hypothetical protein